MLHEVCREYISTSTIEETDLCWHNSILAVRTTKGIQLFEFPHHIQCYDKKLNWRVSLIHTSKFSPTADLIPKSYLQNKARNLELSQIVLDSGLWPQNRHLVKEVTGVTSFEWSPVGAINNNESVLAVLTNIGGVEIYAQKRPHWESKVNVSMILKNVYLPSDHPVPESFEEVLKVVKSVEITAICWMPILNDKSCYFVTAMRDSKILFWKLNFHQGTKAEFISDVPTEFGEVTTMLWITKTNHNFTLICSNKMGQIFCLDCSNKKDIVTLNKFTTIWAHKDRMVAQYLQHTTIGDKLILFTSKHRHLTVHVINKNLELLFQTVHNVNDYRITSLTCNSGIFYLTTANNKIYQINFELFNDQMSVKLDEFAIKDAYSNYEFFGASASTNGVIWAVGMFNRKIKNRKYQQALEIVFFAPELESQRELEMLIQNPTKCLTSHWDCIELVRCKVMKQKLLPSIDYDDLYQEGIQDQYKLKIYLILATLYNELKRILRASSRELPENSQDVIVDRIYSAHAVAILNELYETCHGKPKLLSRLQIEIFAAARRFISNFCQKYGGDISVQIEPSVFDLVDSDLKYTCQCCDETLQGFSCANGHANTFCSKTFTLIESDDYLACKGCERIARIELYETNPKCLFCDLYLINYQVAS